LLVAAAGAVLLTACDGREEQPVARTEPVEASAATPGQTQTPARGASDGIFDRRQVGEAQVVSIFDGTAQVELGLFQNIEPAQTEQLLRTAGAAVPPIFTIHGFLVDVGGRRVLIDAGAGGTMGATAGKLPENLAKAGVTPASVQAILLSHLHGDHAGGIVDAQGRARYPNATLYAHADEVAFWTSTERAAAAPEAMRPFFQLARNALAAYEGRLRTFKAGAEIVPGITAEPVPGHTPGHTVYRLKSGDQELVFVGDLIHSLPVQMPRPDVTLQFDVDQPAARAARLALLQRLAGQPAQVAGPHFPFPGIGRIERNGEVFSFTPVAAQPAS
jgi:glyoxylase-like metal-dependent hydrolase (beta-lactamase superfamily II)